MKRTSLKKGTRNKAKGSGGRAFVAMVPVYWTVEDEVFLKGFGVRARSRWAAYDKAKEILESTAWWNLLCIDPTDGDERQEYVIGEPWVEQAGDLTGLSLLDDVSTPQSRVTSR